MKSKQTPKKSTKQAKKGAKGGKSHYHNGNDFLEEDYSNPLESSPQIFSGDLLR